MSMDDTGSSGHPLRFSNFELDLRARELRKHGTKIKLQDQPLQILALLLEKPGEVVTREELRDHLWPADTFVDFDHSLNSAVKKLRQALNDDPDVPRFIETLPRRGYRFIAPVGGGASPSSPAQAVESPIQSGVASPAEAPPTQPAPYPATHPNTLQIVRIIGNSGRRAVLAFVWRLESLPGLGFRAPQTHPVLHPSGWCP